MATREKHGKRSGEKIVKQERCDRAMEMRSTGMTYREIAVQLDVSPTTVHRLVKAEIAKERTEWTETREDIRDLDLRKLAWLERRLMHAANEGDWKAARLLIAAIQLRRSYMKELPPTTTPRERNEEFEQWFGALSATQEIGELLDEVCSEA